MAVRDQSRLHQFGKKVLPGIFLGCELFAGEIWKGDILIADLEALENLDASEILSSENQRERSIDITKKKAIHIPGGRWYSKTVGRDYDFQESTPRREQTEWIKVFSEKLQGESGESQPTETTDDAEACADF